MSALAHRGAKVGVLVLQDTAVDPPARVRTLAYSGRQRGPRIWVVLCQSTFSRVLVLIHGLELVDVEEVSAFLVADPMQSHGEAFASRLHTQPADGSVTQIPGQHLLDRDSAMQGREGLLFAEVSHADIMHRLQGPSEYPDLPR